MKNMLTIVLFSLLAFFFRAEDQRDTATPVSDWRSTLAWHDLTFDRVLHLFSGDLLTSEEIDFLLHEDVGMVEARLWRFADECRYDYCNRSLYFLLMGKFFEEVKEEEEVAKSLYSLSYFYFFDSCIRVFPEVDVNDLRAVFVENTEDDKTQLKKACNKVLSASQRNSFHLSPLTETCLISAMQCPRALEEIDYQLAANDDFFFLDALKELQEVIAKKTKRLASKKENVQRKQRSNSSQKNNKYDNIVRLEESSKKISSVSPNVTNNSVEKTLKERLEEKKENIRQLLLKEKERYRHTHESIKRIFASYAYTNNLPDTDYEIQASRYNESDIGIRIEAKYFLMGKDLKGLEGFIDAYQKTIQKFAERKQQSFRDLAGKLQILIPEEHFAYEGKILGELSPLAAETRVAKVTGTESLILVLESARFLKDDLKTWQRTEREMITELRILRNQLGELD